MPGFTFISLLSEPTVERLCTRFTCPGFLNPLQKPKGFKCLGVLPTGPLGKSTFIWRGVLKIGSMISPEEGTGSGQSLKTGVNDVLNCGGIGQMCSTCGDGKQSSLSRQAWVCFLLWSVFIFLREWYVTHFCSMYFPGQPKTMEEVLFLL